MRKTVWFIINPKSGTKSKKNIEELIAKILNPSKFIYQVFYTEAPKHATKLAAEGARKGVDIVAVVGGDGTVHEAGQGLIGTQSSLAIIPLGSGNGLARHLRIPLQTEKALNLLNTYTEKKIDTVKINGAFYLNVAGIGFDAHVGHLFAKTGKRGFLRYILCALKAFSTYVPQEYHLIIDGQECRRKALLISFANSSQWGNNACIAPQATLDDGLIDISILKEFPRCCVFNILIGLFTKSLHKSKYLETLQAQKIVLIKEEKEGHIDGEPCSFKVNTSMSIHPASLKILVLHNREEPLFS